MISHLWQKSVLLIFASVSLLCALDVRLQLFVQQNLSPKSKSCTVIQKFHYSDLFSLPAWHGVHVLPTVLPSLPLQSHCVKHQNFPPAVIITDALKRQSLSPTWTATDAESLKFCILTTLKLQSSCHSNNHPRNGISLKSNSFIYLYIYVVFFCVFLEWQAAVIAQPIKWELLVL